MLEIDAVIGGEGNGGVRKRGLQSSENELTISVDSPQRKYHKKMELPVSIDPETPKASYKNGVLEIILKREKPGPKGKDIKIE